MKCSANGKTRRNCGNVGHFPTVYRSRLKPANNIQLLDEAEQNIVIYQWRADQLFADAEGRGK